MSTVRAVSCGTADRLAKGRVLQSGVLIRHYIYIVVIAGLAVGLYLARLWQPEEQVNKHSEHLIAALTAKNWNKFGGFIANDYHDQWDNDRTAVLQRTREIFRYLRDAKMAAVAASVQTDGRRGYWRATIMVDGRDDNEVMAVLKERVNHLQSPFEFEWQHMSGKPWDWKLVAVRNPALTIPAEY